MAYIILTIAFLVEAVFTAYCVVSKSNQPKAKSIIRISVLAAFIVLALLSAIEWSFRWYGLAMLLFIWGVIGVSTLLNGKRTGKEYNLGRMIGKRFLAFLLIATVKPERWGCYRMVQK